jgi:3-methyladenine DNA glycosylase AlkD
MDNRTDRELTIVARQFFTGTDVTQRYANFWVTEIDIWAT